MKTITTTGGNLYQLAAQYLNDGTQWTASPRPTA
jgi:hypothetical protein